MGYVTTINNETTARRNQLKSVMDDFCTFSWGGCSDMFGEYGAFIVGGKDALKFYNGPGFSNEYAQPQFNKAAGQLQGVNFTTQQISFTMGVYWITEEDYRKLIHLLHPLRVSFLAFGFETKYGYQAKLSKLGDSTRNPIGRNEDGKIVYYTEIPLTFEVQGAQCAIAQNPFEWSTSKSQDEDGNHIYTTTRKLNEETKEKVDDAPENSDLPFPIEYSFKLQPVLGGDQRISLNAKYPGLSSIELFNIELQYLTGNPENEEFILVGIKYKSDLGVLFLQYGNGIEKILSLVDYTDIGEKLVKSCTCNKFNIPGRLEQPNFNINDLELKLISSIPINEQQTLMTDENIPVILVTGFARTNVI